MLASQFCVSKGFALAIKPGQSQRSLQPMAIPFLILFTESLDIRLAVRIEKFLAALLPRRFEFGCRNVPVRPAFLEDDAQVLAEIFYCGPPEEPVSVVNLTNDRTGLQDNHVGDHGIVDRISVFRDVEIFLDERPGSERKGQWAPTPPRYSFVSVMLSVLIVTSRQYATPSSRCS
jgi:hypothetical protein